MSEYHKIYLNQMESVDLVKLLYKLDVISFTLYMNARIKLYASAEYPQFRN